MSLVTSRRFWHIIRGGADKSSARPGRKQATATKIGIQHTPNEAQYTSYPVALTFASHSKNIQKFRPTRSPRQQWPPRRTKNCQLSIVFSVQGTGGSPTGPYPEIRVGDQDFGSPGRPVSSGLQVPGEPGALSCKNKTPLATFPRCFSFKKPFNCASRDEQYSTLIFWPFGR